MAIRTTFVYDKACGCYTQNEYNGDKFVGGVYGKCPTHRAEEITRFFGEITIKLTAFQNQNVASSYTRQ